MNGNWGNSKFFVQFTQADSEVQDVLCPEENDSGGRLCLNLCTLNQTLDNKVTFFLVQSIRISIHKNQTWRVESAYLSQSERLGERNSNGKALTPEGPNKILDQEFHMRNIDRNSST